MAPGEGTHERIPQAGGPGTDNVLDTQLQRKERISPGLVIFRPPGWKNVRCGSTGHLGLWGGMQIFVKTPTGEATFSKCKSKRFYCCCEEKIQEKWKLPYYGQVLLFAGKTLHRTLYDLIPRSLGESGFMIINIYVI